MIEKIFEVVHYVDEYEYRRESEKREEDYAHELLDDVNVEFLQAIVPVSIFRTAFRQIPTSLE